jgi:hypothetical protein
MSKQILSSLMLVVSIAFSFPVHAETLTTQQIDHMAEVLGLKDRPNNASVTALGNAVFSAYGTMSCRANGYSCQSSSECCSYCSRNVCGGDTYNKPDGASCQSSSECKTYCSRGVCGGQTYNKPDGAECESSSECKTYCSRGRCGGV